MSYYRTVMSVLFVTLLGFYVLNTTPFNTSTEATKGMYTVGLSIVTLVMLMLIRVEDRIADRLQKVLDGQAAAEKTQSTLIRAALEATQLFEKYTRRYQEMDAEQTKQLSAVDKHLQVLSDLTCVSATRIDALSEAMNATIESVHTKSLDELAALRALVTKHLTDDSVESEKELKSMLNGYFPKVERELVNGYEHAKNILSKLGQAAASVLNTKPQEDGNKTA